MRKLTIAELRKMGCVYCADSVGKNPPKCPYEKCPYEVLEKYDTYGKFLKSKDAIWGFEYEND